MSYRTILAKEKAKNLYNTGKYINKVIAKKAGVTEKTLQTWIKDEGWKIGLIKLAQVEGLKSVLEAYNDFLVDRLKHDDGALKKALKSFLIDKTETY